MDQLVQTLSKKMDKAIENLQKDFKKVRTGRANPSMLDGITVDYYGTPTAMAQVGNISVPEPQMMLVTPWEKSLLGEIEKAILKADIGITPQNDGNVVRLPIPPLTEERRKEMVKQIKKFGEDAKISIRNVRREGNDKLKKMEKDKEISQDDVKTGTSNVQDVTDKHVKEIDRLIVEKEKELMQV